MRIDGKLIAQDIFNDLTKKVEELQKKNITPHVAIVLVGDDPASASYVRQKELKTGQIGGRATIIKLPADISEVDLLSKIQQLNSDPIIHGIIVQRPLPKHIDSHKIDAVVDSKKDIDAFKEDSPYQMPLAAAVLKILEYILYQDKVKSGDQLKLLQDHFIVVIGKGETGGGPTITLLRKLGVEVNVIDSKTENPDSITKKADVIISTVGKHNVVKKDAIKPGVILIGVGMHRGEDNKLHADYIEDDIKDIASYYTPVPGGVGPLNVAMLLKNLLSATIL